MKAWNVLDGYEYAREASLGDALRAWIAQNAATEHEAAIHLQQGGVLGAIGNLQSWLTNVPSGELFTVRARAFQDVTGIDVDRLMVAVAKQKVLTADPSLEGIVTFTTYVTRREMVEMALAYAENYGGNTRCVTFQLGIHESRLTDWKSGTYQPNGEDLEKLVTGLSRGLLEVACVEDFFVARICQGMFGLAPEVVFPGINRFETLLAALFHILGKRKSAEDKKRVFDLNVATVGRLRAWKPRENRLPMSSVIKVVRALLRHKHPGVVPAFDAASDAFAERWTMAEPLALTVESTAIERPTEPARARMKPQTTERAEPDTTDPSPVAPAHSDRVVGTPQPVADDIFALLAQLKHAGPLLRGLADIVDPTVPTAAPLPAEPFAIAIGETVDEMEHCLSGDGFPDFRKATPTETDARNIRRMLALMRKLLLAIGGLTEGEKTRLMQDIGGDVQEMVLLAYAIGKYGNVRTAIKIIEANLQMGRNETRSNKSRGKQ
ncbi:hypothetical protein EBS80_03495 [bacterium]|nr:hypothetical protein [bacterium]